MISSGRSQDLSPVGVHRGLRERWMLLLDLHEERGCVTARLDGTPLFPVVATRSTRPCRRRAAARSSCSGASASVAMAVDCSLDTGWLMERIS